jgi:hypothetical protein
MGEPKQEIPATQRIDAEIELSAYELVALVAPDEMNTSESAVPQTTAMPLEAAPVNTKHAESLNRRTLRHRAIFAGCIVATIACAVIVYTHAASRSRAPVQNTWKTAFPRPIGPTDISEPAEPAPQAAPVRYANPFDASEVFELPAGTSRSAAREAVAEMLLQRALERQHPARKQSLVASGVQPNVNE